MKHHTPGIEAHTSLHYHLGRRHRRSSSMRPQPPRASFDDDRDLDQHLEHLQQLQQRRKPSSTLLTVDGQEADQQSINDENKGGFEADDDFNNEDEEEEEEIEVERRWFAFEIAHCPPSLKLLVRFFRFFFFSFSGVVFTSTATATAENQNGPKFASSAAAAAAKFFKAHRKISDISSTSNNNNNYGYHNNSNHQHFGQQNHLQLPQTTTDISRRQSSILTTTTFKFNRSLLSKLISTWTLLANSFVILTFLAPILLGPMEMPRREAQTFFKMQDNVREALSNFVSHSKNLTGGGIEFGLHEFFGGDDDEYWEEFMHLKPILRNLTKSAVYIFMIDALCQFLFNLFLGGRLVSRIARLPGLAEVGDCDRKLAYQLLAGTFLIISGFSLAGLLIFNQKQLKTLVELVLQQFNRGSGAGGGKGVDEEEVEKLVQTALVVCVHQYHYFILAMVSVLFVYTMVTGRRILEAMRTEVTGGEDDDGEEEAAAAAASDLFNFSHSFKRRPPLSEAHLHDLKRRLTLLAAHFSGIVSALALPITTVMLSNALLIIGSFCFLLIHKLKEDDYFVVFIFNLGAFAFCRLVLLCAWGNALTTGHRELVRAIYEAMADGGTEDDSWTLPKWMAFLEIKRLGARFEVNIGGVYSVKQSAILTVLAFSLNYIVVLLQTETYGGQQQAAVNDSESAGLESWADLGAAENSTL